MIAVNDETGTLMVQYRDGERALIEEGTFFDLVKMGERLSELETVSYCLALSDRAERLPATIFNGYVVR